MAEARVLTMRQAAEHLGVHLDTLRRVLQRNPGEIGTPLPEEIPHVSGHGRRPTHGVYVDDLDILRGLMPGTGNGHGNGHSVEPVRPLPDDEVDMLLEGIINAVKRLRKVLKSRDAEVKAEARREALATLGEELVRNAGR